MSATVPCTGCGAAFPVDANVRFCGQCGAARTATGATVTAAVREATAAASDAQKSETYGQQKWGLFETNSQRARGITTEQSLNEIDDAVRDGVVVRGTGAFSSGGFSHVGGGSTTRTVEVTTTTGGSVGSAGSAAGAGAGASSSGGGGGTGNFGSSTTRGTTGTYGETLDSQKFGGPAGGGGAAFLAQHTERENAKYKPGYKGTLS